jgi:hypothetical protein
LIPKTRPSRLYNGVLFPSSNLNYLYLIKKNIFMPKKQYNIALDVVETVTTWVKQLKI